ncbi:hemolysin D [Hallella multisaccharivorax DSM 17128]|uniref:Efflux transporter, RND family, MFP subunit n=1 Tax=Hallella multisaccharivorax DSM 17128 TaxID=688246 RepID=F8N5X4_9BACT|nr:efflux RND transporter periplasmic adaptor subunit [Hallella multisaccharivorax]EGN57158.1 efflux transporter, RND family, MFP subunit [Hallella multisaccharivorax DSM 17128]GJG31600.1 hemolysin D [Hallella multisaccharivorax DSM 17128]
MKIKSCLFVALVAALTLVSCGKKSGGGLASLQDNEFAVRTAGVSSADMQTTYPATIKGIQDVDVHPKISGFITNVYVHEGQTVSAGQPMFTIDSETYRAQVSQARAALNTARAQANTARLTYLNNKKLFDQHIIGQYELETAQNSYSTAQAQVAQAQAALASASETLSWCVVRAPSAGVVGSLPFKKGALVSAQNTLTTVSDISTVEVFFSMSEPDILSMSKTAGSVAGVLKEMPMVKLQLADGTIYNQPGRVVKMSGVIDASTGAYTLIAHFSNPQRLLKSGGAGQIVVPHVSNSAIIIPQEATVQVQDKIFVYLVGSNNKVKYTEIKVNPQDDGINYIVTAGLHVGDRYVSKGITKLTDGEQIKPLTEEQYQQKIDKAEKLGAQQSSAKGFVNAMKSK